MRDQSAMGKVVVRSRDGRVVQGFASDDYISSAEVKILSQKGKEISYALDEVKAVFFVKDFEGDSDYEELKFLKNHPPKKWIWARVTFIDGETLEGRVENSKKLFEGNGFYLWPSDEATNNDLVFVIRSAIGGFEILSN